MWIMLAILLLYGTLGFLDDFIKIFKQRNMGLTSLQKLVGQIVGGILLYTVFKAKGYPTTLSLPFNVTLDLGILYGVFVVIWLVGFSNAVNLTDGLDGLVALVWELSHLVRMPLLHGININMMCLLVCLAVMGGLLGFFLFNKNQRKIFMGDVGSLALGGLLASISIILKQEWTLLLVGLVYVIETLSVIMQVTSFKLTGKRIF